MKSPRPRPQAQQQGQPDEVAPLAQQLQQLSTSLSKVRSLDLDSMRAPPDMFKSKSEIENLQGQLRAERELRQVAEEQYLSPQKNV